MPPKLIEGTPQSLTIAQITDHTDASLLPFLHACRHNDAALALQLAPGRESGALTFGLNRALDGGHLDLARQLLAAGAKWDFNTVSHSSDSLDVVKLLVDFGFDVNTGLVAGGVLLSMAVRVNNEPCIRYLLERGANPNLGAPLNQRGPLSQIRPVTNSCWTLNHAAAFCTPEIFALLLSYGADVSNATPVHSAVGTSPDIVLGSRIPMLEYLIGLGLDIDAMTAHDGSPQPGTPLQNALLWGRVEEAKWLLDRGADLDKKAPDGISARVFLEQLPRGAKLAILSSTSKTKVKK